MALPQDRHVRSFFSWRDCFTLLSKILKTALAVTTYADQIALAPDELQQHWIALEDFRLFLDNFEQELNRRDCVKDTQIAEKPNFSIGLLVFAPHFNFLLYVITALKLFEDFQRSYPIKL